MKGQRVGHTRVSSTDQNPERQLERLKLDRVFTDKAWGKDTQRLQLDLLFSFVREGDLVIVHSMDRLARNLDDRHLIVHTLMQRGMRIEFVKEQLSFSGEDSPMANRLLSVMGAFAEFERALIRERQAEGIALAKARGAFKGTQAGAHRTAAFYAARAKAGEAKAALADEFGISRATVYQYL